MTDIAMCRNPMCADRANCARNPYSGAEPAMVGQVWADFPGPDWRGCFGWVPVNLRKADGAADI